MRVILIFILLYFISSCQPNSEGVQKNKIADAVADTLPKEINMTNLATTEELDSWEVSNINELAVTIKAISTTLNQDGSGKVNMLRKDSLMIYLDMEWSLKNDTMESTVSNFVSYQLIKDKKTGIVTEKLVEEKGEYSRLSQGKILELTSRTMKVQDIDNETIYEYQR